MMIEGERVGATGEESGHAHLMNKRARVSQFDNIQTRENQSDQFRLASRLAAGGLPLVRLAPGTNRPNLEQWPKLATTDLDTLAAWNTEQPDCNWGVLVGNGLGVLDLDTKSDPHGFGGYSSLIDIEDLLRVDLSNLPLVHTASGSHLYFRYSGRLDSRVPWVPNLDVKADGGHQVAAPGTVRVVDGHEVTYRLVRGDLSAVPEAPEALLAAIRGWRARSSSSPSSGAQWVSEHLPATSEAITDGLEPGNRNSTMHRLASRWWRERGTGADAEVYDLARQVWEATPDHDSFPWREVESAVESARRFVESQHESDARFIEMWKESRHGA